MRAQCLGNRTAPAHAPPHLAAHSGCFNLLLRLQAEITEDAAKRKAARRVVVYLGDYIDRGPASRGVIEHFIKRPLAGFESLHLMGNHDRWLLDFLDDPGQGQAWLMNGGRATLASYGVNDVSTGSQRDQMQGLQQGLLKALPPSHRAFFEGLKLTHTEGDYLFVHAGVRPKVALDAQDPADLLWIREEFLYSDADFGKIVVHGHTPGHTPEEHANRIAIDTGAFMTGRLTAVALEGSRRRFLYAQESLG